MNTIEVNRFSDLHVHFREGEMLKLVAPMTAQYCDYALSMPNLTPPSDNIERLIRYREELEGAFDGKCKPLMSVKLLPWMTKEHIKAFKEAVAVAAKIYPEGVTTNSSDGFSKDYFDIQKTNSNIEFYDLLDSVQENDLVLCIHGEMPGSFCFDREKDFLHWVYNLSYYLDSRIVLEQFTTKEAVNQIEDGPENIAATITPHHLIMTLDDVIGGELQPHNFCKPIAKRREDKEALQQAALGQRGNRFFLGSDSAPHTIFKKECANGCAGCFTAPVYPAILADFFASKLPDLKTCQKRFQEFTSENGNKYYKLSTTGKKVKFMNEDWSAPTFYHANEFQMWSVGSSVRSFMEKKTFSWRLVE
jgi:dihydroorotase